VAACQGGRLVVQFTNRKNAPFLFSTRIGTRPPAGLDRHLEEFAEAQGWCVGLGDRRRVPGNGAHPHERPDDRPHGKRERDNERLRGARSAGTRWHGWPPRAVRVKSDAAHAGQIKKR
jgi:hypothetical protein